MPLQHISDPMLEAMRRETSVAAHPRPDRAHPRGRARHRAAHDVHRRFPGRDRGGFRDAARSSSRRPVSSGWAFSVIRRRKERARPNARAIFPRGPRNRAGKRRWPCSAASRWNKPPPRSAGGFACWWKPRRGPERSRCARSRRPRLRAARSARGRIRAGGDRRRSGV